MGYDCQPDSNQSNTKDQISVTRKVLENLTKVPKMSCKRPLNNDNVNYSQKIQST